MRQTVGIVVICLASLAANAQNAPAEQQIDLEHTKWVENVLRSIQSVKVGSPRSELLKLFTTEGGISSASQRTYVYRHCPYIKVDVKFAASSPGKELPTDKIVEMSRPYLEWSIED